MPYSCDVSRESAAQGTGNEARTSVVDSGASVPSISHDLPVP